MRRKDKILYTVCATENPGKSFVTCGIGQPMGYGQLLLEFFSQHVSLSYGCRKGQNVLW